MANYIEKEVKILDINKEELTKRLEKLGALKIFDWQRTFTTFDTIDHKYTNNKQIIRLTEESKLKLSINNMNKEWKIETVKLFVSRKEETIDFLKRLEINPITEVKSYRISYELDGIDIDIDIFPEIPAFVEIDIETLQWKLPDLLKKLWLEKNEVVEINTEEIFTKYGKKYQEIFTIQ